MKRLTKVFKGGQTGFTLIELLIVIVILGVLAAAIIPNLSRFVGSGQVGAANAELATVRTGIAAYQAENDGDYPCAAQPAVTDDTWAEAEDVDLTLIDEYVNMATFEGTYKVDFNGIVYTNTHTDTRVTAAADHLTWVSP